MSYRLDIIFYHSNFYKHNLLKYDLKCCFITVSFLWQLFRTFCRHVALLVHAVRSATPRSTALSEKQIRVCDKWRDVVCWSYLFRTESLRTNTILQWSEMSSDVVRLSFDVASCRFFCSEGPTRKETRSRKMSPDIVSSLPRLVLSSNVFSCRRWLTRLSRSLFVCRDFSCSYYICRL